MIQASSSETEGSDQVDTLMFQPFCTPLADQGESVNVPTEHVFKEVPAGNWEGALLRRGM